MDQNSLAEQISTRRTFAIISHPDAGKTTLTEKLLLYSGQLRTAGMVRGRKGKKMAASDWMALEQERGISVTASAMQFSYKDNVINILDTPGHEDFSEDTYRTLTAADCAIMVIDAAKGIEKQTLKLFEVCRLRRIPVLTLINKMDMPGRDPLDLMDEVENALHIRTYAYNWPTGSGKDFTGVFDRASAKFQFFHRTEGGNSQRAQMTEVDLTQALQLRLIGSEDAARITEETSLLDGVGHPFAYEDFVAGEVTPVFFASALSNYGIEPFFDAFIHLAPSPSGRYADGHSGNDVFIDPSSTPFSGYVFKIQSNMDLKHRDSLAFIRICSGRFEKDMIVKHHRLKRDLRLSRPQSMFAGERKTLDEALAGDIIGVINPGLFHIGDTVSISGGFDFKPLPQFQPEIFAKFRPIDISKRKAFDKGIAQMAEEGAVQILKVNGQQNELVFGAAGKLQLEVMQYRLLDEYKVETEVTPLPYQDSAWIEGKMETFKKPSAALYVIDRFGRNMVLFNSAWEKRYASDQNPEHKLLNTSY